MSNPFADPQSQRMDSNPFDDPSISNAMGSQQQVYDEEDALSMQTGGAKAGDSGMQSRFDDLARREQELAAREANLNARADHIRKHGRNNWPPGPYPLIYHDIDEEIPAEARKTVWTLYRIWQFLLLVLIVNLVGAILLLISGAADGGADLGASIMYVPVIGIFSFLLWYRPVYNGYMKEQAFFYYMYYIFVLFHCAFTIYMAIGIPSTGAAGLINCISSFANGHIVAGVFCVLGTVGWALEALASLFMFRIVYRHANGDKGYTFAQAQEEIKIHGLKAYLLRGSRV